MLIDAHCDTITKIMETGENLLQNQCHIDIERLKKYPGAVQFFAAFIHPLYRHGAEMKQAIRIIDRYYEELGQWKAHIRHCNNAQDIEAAHRQGKAAAMLSIEGGEALQGELAALRMFYKLGVRSICLTWNHRNEIADGIGEGPSGGGLSAFGREVVAEMNRLGMLVDVSHLSVKGFWDVMEESKAPIIASHSNAKALCSHRRNLNDDQLKAIKEKGGVIGINLYPGFLHDSEKAGSEDVIRHIEYIAGITGEDHLGLGADFDGIETTPEDLRGVQDMEKLLNLLLQGNYSEAFVRKLTGENFMRVIREVCI